MINDCDALVKDLNLPKGKCCTGCHSTWEEGYSDEVNPEKVDIAGKIYYICCKQYENYKETLCQRS